MLRMRRALTEYTIMGIKHNIPFHQNLFDSYNFQRGKFHTKFVEEQFSMSDNETSPTEQELEAVALSVTLYAHRKRQLAAQVVTRAERDTSNWKWLGRWERLNR